MPPKNFKLYFATGFLGWTTIMLFTANINLRAICESPIAYLSEMVHWYFKNADLHHYNYELIKNIILVPASVQWKQHNLPVHST